ncbi:hypothetical protein OH77DRAFT_1422306 [Trametes cingulata]|nr:hypothetical protein OH77DRAFT_1422306 [Trametes cingulata]
MRYSPLLVLPPCLSASLARFLARIKLRPLQERACAAVVASVHSLSPTRFHPSQALRVLSDVSRQSGYASTA